jgi:hypothetical protein
VWFQSLGTVLAFDWNASGLTTTLTAAIKEALRGRERELGVFVCGGKGKTSRKTPEEIRQRGVNTGMGEDSIEGLVYNSKMAAKVDSALIQDGFQIYHHAFFFSKNGAWTVVQQGMNQGNLTARRYHWFSENAKDLIREPHTGIASQIIGGDVMNLTAEKSEDTRQISLEMVNESYIAIKKDIEILRKHFSSLSQTASFKKGNNQLTLLNIERKEFHSHPVEKEDFSKSRYLEKILAKLSFEKPASYESMLATEGVGPKTVRALALVSEVIYGAAPSYEDPARYSFAHGGKDATPYPVDRAVYDKTIDLMKRAVMKTRIGLSEKNKIMETLAGKD